MNNINRRLKEAEKQLHIGKKKMVVIPYTDENGIEHKVELTQEQWNDIIRNIKPTKRILPCHEKEYYERLKNDKIKQKPTE